MSEELTFTWQPEHMSLDYTLLHNIPTLRTLWVEDSLSLQVSPGEPPWGPRTHACIHSADVLGSTAETRGGWRKVQTSL